MMIKLRGEDPDAILSLVHEVEKNSGFFPKADTRSFSSKSFYASGGSLKATKGANVLRKISNFSTPLVAKLAQKTGARVPLRREKRLISENVFADQIRVKNNVLALYPEAGLVCKCRRPTSMRAPDSLYNEYQVLNAVADCDGLEAPKTLAYYSEPVPTLWLGYLIHKKVTAPDKKLIAYRVAESLLSWYTHCGIKRVTLGEYAPVRDALEGGCSSLRDFGWTEPEAQLIYSVLSRASESAAPILQSQIHGDASTGNAMITEDGGLVVTDWENSRVDLVAHDLDKLSQDAPEILDLYSQWRLKYVFNEKHTSMDVQREFALVRILRGLNLEQKLRYYTEVSSITWKEAESRIRREKISLVRACKSLVD